jgi:hypothetical protein
MGLSQKRMEFIRHSMNISATWIDVLEEELVKCSIGGSTDEFNRLQGLLTREKELYDALRHALIANMDTFALL